MGGIVLAVLDRSLDGKILASAKHEFLENGFVNANLRAICKNAGTTTGAVYNRYKGKGELFAELVRPAIEALNKRINSASDIGKIKSLEIKKRKLLDISVETEPTMNFIYDYYDEFRLLCCCSEGSPYSDFLHGFIETNTNNNWEWMNNLKEICDLNIEIKVNKEELHLILTTYWTAVFQPISHEFSRERAIFYCGILSNFLNLNSIIEIK